MNALKMAALLLVAALLIILLHGCAVRRTYSSNSHEDVLASPHCIETLNNQLETVCCYQTGDNLTCEVEGIR